jgi:YD repeat-containing protein
MAFHYSYDAAGNVLAYTRVVDGISTVTSYTYDDANQLLTAAEGETTWYYTYDNNGSLVMSSPIQGEASGATRNTYNKAGYLVKVEGHDGTAWQTQAEMRYDGLGNRLEMTSYADGVSETIRYQLDNGQPLAAVGTESTSYYLYGRGVIGTKTDTSPLRSASGVLREGYVLQDGLGSTRQLATHEGVIAMSVAYTPWGDVLEYYGSGGIDFGYLGGIYDDTTGLIYLGGGQYYTCLPQCRCDPVTGRMLTRGAGQSNPYKPGAFDPAGMMVAPLALIGLALGKKKKRGKWDSFIVLLVVCVVVGMSVSACTPVSPEGEDAELTSTATATPIPTQTPASTSTPAPASTKNIIISITPEVAVIAITTIIDDDCNNVKVTPPQPTSTPTIEQSRKDIEDTYKVKINGNGWTEQWLNDLESAIRQVDKKLSNELRLPFTEGFVTVYGKDYIFQCPENDISFGITYFDRVVFRKLYENQNSLHRNPRVIIHELGHGFDYRYCENTRGNCLNSDILRQEGTIRLDLDKALKGEVMNFGSSLDNGGKVYRNLDRPDYGKPDDEFPYRNFAGGKEEWQFAMDYNAGFSMSGEIWADMYLGWIYDNLSGDRREYMEDAMNSYLRVFR